MEQRERVVRQREEQHVARGRIGRAVAVHELEPVRPDPDILGDDLQIYHDGSNSYVSDVGAGELRLQGSSYVKIMDAAGETGLTFRQNEGVTLNYDNSQKLATTSTGIDVTGVVEATGYLAVEGTSGNTGVGTDRWIGGDGTAGTWYYNVPTGSNHYFGVNNTVLGGTQAPVKYMIDAVFLCSEAHKPS